MSDGNIQSLEISSSSSNEHLHQWLAIIGIVTIALILLLSCIKCILKIRQTYQNIDLNKQRSTSGKSIRHSNYLYYPNYKQIHNSEYRISISNEPASLSVHIV